LETEFSALSWIVAIRVRPSASRAISTPSRRWKNVLTASRTERFSHAVGEPTIRGSDAWARDEALVQRNALTRAFVVAGTGVDPVTPRFSGACSAD
jgi:hypothetical protein